MKSFHFDPRSRAPIVSALICGPLGTRRVRLVFDTGAEMTQINSNRMKEIGYDPNSGIAKASIVGIGGVESVGQVIALKKIVMLGAEADNIKVAAFDMQKLSTWNLDGLLGWDIIRAFHLEMNGPEGRLTIF